MPLEEKHKINVWIPGSLWKQIGSLGYDSPTKATIAAFEALVLQEEKGSNQEVLGSSQEAIGSNQEEIRKYQEIILPNLENKTRDLEKRPDLVEFVQLQARFEGLQMILEEKDKRIEGLENDLKKADIDKEDLKQMHNNYFLQVQTLINQKAIGSPREATGSNQEEIGSSQEDKPAAEKKVSPQKGEKPLIEKTCKNCNETHFPHLNTKMPSIFSKQE